MIHKFLDKDAESVAYIDEFYGKHWKYGDFASGLKSEFFNQWLWADIFADSGAKWVEENIYKIQS